MLASRLLGLFALGLAAVSVAAARGGSPAQAAADCVVCLPAVEKVTTTRPCYRCQCKTICLPCCGECGRPRTVRVLIKRFVKQEKWEVKCKPQPSAGPVGGCAGLSGVAPGVTSCVGGARIGSAAAWQPDAAAARMNGRSR